MLGTEQAWTEEGLGQLREVLSTTPLLLPERALESKEANGPTHMSFAPPTRVGAASYEVEPEGLEHASDEGQDGTTTDGLNLEEVMLDVRRSQSDVSKASRQHRRDQDSILCCSSGLTRPCGAVDRRDDG
jgi:hypothetical protein